jgi:uncharacterized protein YceH (UPF0502 family)
MSPEPEAGNTTQPAWPILSVLERRVLGVLVEKAKTTPDAYPMSLNALTTGCNQKSNRDPVMNLTDDAVEETLLRLQKQNLASKIVGGRVERWRHLLYEAWRADKVELAVLAELLLRGPQTEGELRSRASRMEPIDDLDALRNILHKLVERRLVAYLTPEGRRGTVLSHGFHAPHEVTALRQVHPTEASIPSSGLIPASPSPAVRSGPRAESLEADQTDLASARAEIAELRSKVADLEGIVARLDVQMQELRQSLGG